MIPPTSSPRRHKPISARRIINTALQEQKAPVAVQPLRTLPRDVRAVRAAGKKAGTNGELQPARYLHAHAVLSGNLFALKLAHKVG